MTRLTGGPEKGLVMVKEPIWGKDSVRLAEVKMSHDFEVLVRKMPVHLRLLPASLRTRIIVLEKFMNHAQERDSNPQRDGITHHHHQMSTTHKTSYKRTTNSAQSSSKIVGLEPLPPLEYSFGGT